MYDRETKNRFWKFVLGSHPDDCWPWNGGWRSKDPHGSYGGFRAGGQYVMAHRFAWEITRGPIPKGMVVCHTCDHPPCCNPGHLFLGTMKQNCMDRSQKGRINHRGRTAALTEEQVREIRATAGTEGKRAIAQRLGVDRCVVARVRAGITYRDVK